MSKMEDVFVDLTEKAVTHNLITTLEAFKGKKIRVATTCSSTDAPIIELRVASCSSQSGLTGNLGLPMKHCYSAEIDSHASNRLRYSQ